MKVAFVGVKRKYQELDPGYIDTFNQFHLELPFYYARDGRNDVQITTVDHVDPLGPEFLSGSLTCLTESAWRNGPHTADVVVHWRRWFPELYKPGAINVINCQDHSFGSEWQTAAIQAFSKGQLYGILCFPTWHRDNLLQECPWLPIDRALYGVTLGVDTDVYHPADIKNPYDMLWASDPGRGLEGAIKLTLELFRRDQRFKLHVCRPDYARTLQLPKHPAIVDRGFLKNGPELWYLFGSTGVLPYPSTFMEPSSRSHRQAMAAGSLVLYPPGKGSPSDLIRHTRDGVVSDPTGWADEIIRRIDDGSWKEIGTRARESAVSENWVVQAARFNKLFTQIRGE